MKTNNLLIAGLLALSLTVLLGCRATEPGSMSHASVQIQGRSRTHRRQTLAVFFGEERYGLAMATEEEMVCERPGSRGDALKWGGWSGNGVTMRVKVQLTRLAGDARLLQADAYAVQNSEDAFFQTESRNILLNRHPYQKLLDEVAKRLK
jgi:hypothetical protein